MAITNNTRSEIMKVVIAPEPGGPEALQIIERDTPTPTGKELLVAVKAAGVNRPDIMQRMGGYPPPPGASDVLGLEIAGEVIAAGDNASRFSVGDRVFGLVASGGYAQYAVIDERNALLAPAGADWTTLGGIPETYFTVWTNMIQRGQLKEGEWVFIHGGSSGIGTTAIQIAKAHGARVAITAGSAEKCQKCLDLGADVAINYKEQEFVEALQKATDGHGFDLCLDMVGGDYVNRNLEAAAPGGRLVQIALQAGPEATINVWQIMAKKLWFTGSTLRARSVEEKAEIAVELERSLMPLWEKGECLPVIDSVYLFEQVVDAHRRMDAPHIGKVILSMEEGA
ncbi:MAG: NAD(P)H-quinone oxidoreductase [Gammaproteobacteria bacterium]|nr:NAD(P)H-quinone oxidoreductase [Gammaproteobacteria bacterium]